jgi:hypothetical protein
MFALYAIKNPKTPSKNHNLVTANTPNNQTKPMTVGFQNRVYPNGDDSGASKLEDSLSNLSNLLQKVKLNDMLLEVNTSQ